MLNFFFKTYILRIKHFDLRENISWNNENHLLITGKIEICWVISESICGVNESLGNDLMSHYHTDRSYLISWSMIIVATVFITVESLVEDGNSPTVAICNCVLLCRCWSSLQQKHCCRYFGIFYLFQGLSCRKCLVFITSTSTGSQHQQIFRT